MVEEADKNYKSRYKLLQQIAAMTVSDAEAPEA
jgi:hypothetical protein